LVNPRISVSAICSPQWSFDEDLAFYERTGVSCVGLSFDKMLQAADGNLDRVEQIAGRVVDAGLRVSNMLGLGVFDLASSDTWPRQEERLLAAVCVGVVVGTGCLVSLSGPAGPLSWEDAVDAWSAASERFRRTAHEAGLVVAVEHTNQLRMDLSFLHNLADTVEVSERLDVGVCMDVSTCWTERALTETVTASVHRLSLVQVADWKVGTRCTPDRAIPGEGDIPLRRILRDVLAAGYGGVFDLEVLGPSAEALGYEAVIGGGMAWLERALPDLGVIA